MLDENMYYQDNEELKLSYFNDKVFPVVFSSKTEAYEILSPVYKGKKFSKKQTTAFMKRCNKYLDIQEHVDGRKLTVLGVKETPDFAATKRKDRKDKWLPWTAYLIADEVTRIAKEGVLKDNCYEINCKDLPVLFGLTNDRELSMKNDEFPLLMYGINKKIAVREVNNVKNMCNTSRRLKDAIEKINSKLEGIRVETVLILVKETNINGKTKKIFVEATKEEITKLERCKYNALNHFGITKENEAYSKNIGIDNFYEYVNQNFHKDTSITGRFTKHFVFIDKEAVEDGRYLLDEETRYSYKLKVNKNILNPEGSSERQKRIIEPFFPCGHAKIKNRFRLCIQECCISSSEDEYYLLHDKQDTILKEYLFNLDKSLIDNLITDATRMMGLA